MQKFDTPSAPPLLRRCSALDLLDDAAFARARARHLAGQNKSAREIRGGGLPAGPWRRDISAAMEEILPQSEAACLAVVEKHYRAKLAAGQTGKVLAALARRGFSMVRQRRPWNEVLAQLEEEGCRFFKRERGATAHYENCIDISGLPETRWTPMMAHALLEAGHHQWPRYRRRTVCLSTPAALSKAPSRRPSIPFWACSHKAQNPALKVVVTAALAERYKEEIRKRCPGGRGGGHRLQYRDCLHPRAAGAGRGGIESYGPKAALPLSAGVSSPRRTTMHI